MKERFILLKDNGKIEVVEQQDKFDLDHVKHVVIPIIGYHSHVVIKPTEFMKFKRGVVRFTIAVAANSRDGNEQNLEYSEETVTEVTNIIEFYNLIHSINRMAYANQFYNNFYQDSKYMDMYSYIAYLDIKLYGKKDVLIYDKDYMPDIEYDDLWYHGDPLTNNFKEVIVYSNEKLYKKDERLHICNNKWDLTSGNIESGLMGLHLKQSKSISFIEPEIYDILKYIENVDYDVIVYSAESKDIKKVSEMFKNNKYNEYDLMEDILTSFENEIWEEYNDILSISLGKPEVLVELLNYFPHIVMSIMLMYKTYMLPNIEYDVILNLQFELIYHDIHKTFTMIGNRDNMQTIDELVVKIYHELHGKD